VRIIKDLVCNDFFEHHTARTHFDLELHFRCIIAGLRLLPMHGIQAGSGTLAYNYFDQLYNRMTWWQNFYNGQTVGVQGEQLKTKNYNNEFLIVYARDLIASSPADRTVASNVATRLIAGASFLGHAVIHPFKIAERLIVVCEKCGVSGAKLENCCTSQTPSFSLER